MHINPDVGIIEILDDAGQPVAEGEVGDVIVSGLGREGMPLFRYRIGDTATAGQAGISCECGLEWPTLGPITGRSEDMLITKDGRRLPLLHHPLKVAQGILEGQIVQEDYENITIRLVCKPGVTTVNEEAIAAELNRRSSGAFSVHFEYMDAIPRKKSGKFKAVVSKVAASAPKGAAVPIATELPPVEEKGRAQ
jgi:phenylacetate-CoA ligase